MRTMHIKYIPIIYIILNIEMFKKTTLLTRTYYRPICKSKLTRLKKNYKNSR